jgi:hypothetical protein
MGGQQSISINELVTTNIGDWNIKFGTNGTTVRYDGLTYSLIGENGKWYLSLSGLIGEGGRLLIGENGKSYLSYDAKKNVVLTTVYISAIHPSSLLFSKAITCATTVNTSLMNSTSSY